MRRFAPHQSIVSRRFVDALQATALYKHEHASHITSAHNLLFRCYLEGFGVPKTINAL
jgi:hypothetical protein